MSNQKCFTRLNENLDALEKNSDEFFKVCLDVALGIQNKTCSVLQLTEHLGSLLTNQSLDKRELGLLIFAEVLKNLDKNSLNEDETGLLSAYFSQQLSHHHQVIPAALKCILAIISCSNVTSGSAIGLVTSIFQHVTCQQQQQQDRYAIYQIFEFVLRKFPQDIKMLGPDVVYGVISSIDGERDPKNLLYLFSWIPDFINTLDLGHLTEEMFEVLACYFPVDFKPSLSEERSISRDDLANQLCLCLTSTKNFGPYCLPLATEKFDSVLDIAQKDSLKLLVQGCNKFDVSVYSEHSIMIWSSIQKEVFSTNNEELRMLCLDAFTAVIDKLTQGNEDEYTNFLTNVIDTLKRNLLPDLKLFLPSSWMLISMAKANGKASNVIANKVIPLLENTYTISTNPKHKACLLKVHANIVQCYLKHNILESLENDRIISSLPVICLQAVTDVNSDLKTEGYNGLRVTTKLLTRDLRKCTLEQIKLCILECRNENLRLAVSKCLEQMAQNYPKETEASILLENSVTSSELDMYLKAICSIFQVPHFQNFIIETLTNYALKNVNVSPVAVKHINKILQAPVTCTYFIEKDFVNKFIYFIRSQDNYETVKDSFLQDSTSVLSKLIKQLTKDQQKDLLKIQLGNNCKLEKVHLAILSSLIVPLDEAPSLDVHYLLKYCNSSDQYVKDISLRMLANLVNKTDDGLPNLLNIIKGFHDTNISIIIWTTKALVMRNHPCCWQWTDELLNLLDRHKEISEGLEIIMNNNVPELSRDNFCKVMTLYQQKFFVYCTNKLVQMYGPEKDSYLLAVAYLMEHAPKSVIISQFHKIVTLIVLCLERCKEIIVLEILINKIHELIDSQESVIENNLEDILLRILHLTTFDSNMKIRIAALQSVKKIALTFPVYKLLPLKKEVIRQLGVCLSDKKRLVRKEAMDARSAWFLIDAEM